MVETTRKKPTPSFAIRLVGPGIRPWVVPMRSLARILEAVQRLVEQRDEFDPDLTGEPGQVRSDDAVLHLLTVKSSSAAYAVAAPDSKWALKTISDLGKAIEHPMDADWLDSTLSSVKEFCEVAKSLRCDIEFRRPGKSGTLGGVIAKIVPLTYNHIKGSAFIHGRTSTYAKIERVGGATEMHCGIRIHGSPRKIVICRVRNADLVRELGQFMYQDLMLHGNATWIRHNWRLKTMVIDSFDPPRTGSILEILRKTHKAGGDAWDAVENPEGLLEEMREA